MNKTLKEIYNCDYVDRPDTSLLKHYNRVLNKTVDELDIEDICMLVRQEMFLDIAIPKAIEIITNDHSAGDYYDYCLLVNLSTIESPMDEYADSLKSLIKVLKKDYDSIEFELETDKDNYVKSIERIENKIKNS